jgi:hypothetical protein
LMAEVPPSEGLMRQGKDQHPGEKDRPHRLPPRFSWPALWTASRRPVKEPRPSRVSNQILKSDSLDVGPLGSYRCRLG